MQMGGEMKGTGVTGNKLEMIHKFLITESTMPKPPEDVVKKILNLSSLIDINSVSTWRGDKKPEIITRRGFRVDSFQSLPSLSSSPKPVHKVHSTESIRTNQKYVSKYRNSEQLVEEKILNTIILSKLNKFSADTYDDIRNFLFQIIGSDDAIQELSDKDGIQDFVKDFMSLVFKKAVSEEIFCPLYAKLLGEISGKYPIILDEMNKLHENYLGIFDEDDEDDQEKESNYEAFLVKNREKKYRQGYSQFLAELTALRILGVDKISIIYEKIFTQILLQGKAEGRTTLIEQYIDCLLRIAKVLRKREEIFYIEIRNILQTIVTTSMIEMNKQEHKSLSSKSKFLLMDIQDYLKGL